MKKYVKLLILLILFWSVIYWIIQSPNSLLTQSTQDKLLDLSDRIDTSFNDIDLSNLK